MMCLLVVTVLAYGCLWRYWDIAKHITDRPARQIYMLVSTGVYIADGVQANLVQNRNVPGASGVTSYVDAAPGPASAGPEEG